MCRSPPSVPALHVKGTEVLQMGALVPINSYTMWIASGLRKKTSVAVSQAPKYSQTHTNFEITWEMMSTRKVLKPDSVDWQQSVGKPLQRKWIMFMLLHFAWQKISMAFQEFTRQSRGGYQSRKTTFIIVLEAVNSNKRMEIRLTKQSYCT